MFKDDDSGYASIQSRTGHGIENGGEWGGAPIATAAILPSVDKIPAEGVNCEQDLLSSPDQDSVALRIENQKLRERIAHLEHAASKGITSLSDSASQVQQADGHIERPTEATPEGPNGEQLQHRSRRMQRLGDLVPEMELKKTQVQRDIARKKNAEQSALILDLNTQLASIKSQYARSMTKLIVDAVEQLKKPCDQNDPEVLVLAEKFNVLQQLLEECRSRATLTARDNARMKALLKAHIVDAYGSIEAFPRSAAEDSEQTIDHKSISIEEFIDQFPIKERIKDILDKLTLELSDLRKYKSAHTATINKHLLKEQLHHQKLGHAIARIRLLSTGNFLRYFDSKNKNRLAFTLNFLVVNKDYGPRTIGFPMESRSNKGPPHIFANDRKS